MGTADCPIDGSLIYKSHHTDANVCAETYETISQSLLVEVPFDSLFHCFSIQLGAFLYYVSKAIFGKKNILMTNWQKQRTETRILNLLKIVKNFTLVQLSNYNLIFIVVYSGHVARASYGSFQSTEEGQPCEFY